MALSQSPYGRLNLGNQGRQIDEIRHPKARASRGNDKEWIFGLHARPARWQGGNIAEAVAIEDQIIAPSDTALDTFDLLSE